MFKENLQLLLIKPNLSFVFENKLIFREKPENKPESDDLEKFGNGEEEYVRIHSLLMNSENVLNKMQKEKKTPKDYNEYCVKLMREIINFHSKYWRLAMQKGTDNTFNEGAATGELWAQLKNAFFPYVWMRDSIDQPQHIDFKNYRDPKKNPYKLQQGLIVIINIRCDAIGFLDDVLMKEDTIKKNDLEFITRQYSHFLSDMHHFPAYPDLGLYGSKHGKYIFSKLLSKIDKDAPISKKMRLELEYLKDNYRFEWSNNYGKKLGTEGGKLFKTLNNELIKKAQSFNSTEMQDYLGFISGYGNPTDILYTTVIKVLNKAHIPIEDADIVNEKSDFYALGPALYGSMLWSLVRKSVTNEKIDKKTRSMLEEEYNAFCIKYPMVMHSINRNNITDKTAKTLAKDQTPKEKRINQLGGTGVKLTKKPSVLVNVGKEKKGKKDVEPLSEKEKILKGDLNHNLLLAYETDFDEFNKLKIRKDIVAVHRKFLRMETNYKNIQKMTWINPEKYPKDLKLHKTLLRRYGSLYKKWAAIVNRKKAKDMLTHPIVSKIPSMQDEFATYQYTPFIKNSDAPGTHEAMEMPDIMCIQLNQVGALKHMAEIIGSRIDKTTTEFDTGEYWWDPSDYKTTKKYTKEWKDYVKNVLNPLTAVQNDIWKYYSPKNTNRDTNAPFDIETALSEIKSILLPKMTKASKGVDFVGYRMDQIGKDYRGLFESGQTNESIKRAGTFIAVLQRSKYDNSIGSRALMGKLLQPHLLKTRAKYANAFDLLILAKKDLKEAKKIGDPKLIAKAEKEVERLRKYNNIREDIAEKARDRSMGGELISALNSQKNKFKASYIAHVKEKTGKTPDITKGEGWRNYTNAYSNFVRMTQRALEKFYYEEFINYISIRDLDWDTNRLSGTDKRLYAVYRDSLGLGGTWDASDEVKAFLSNMGSFLVDFVILAVSLYFTAGTSALIFGGITTAARSANWYKNLKWAFELARMPIVLSYEGAAFYTFLGFGQQAMGREWKHLWEMTDTSEVVKTIIAEGTLFGAFKLVHFLARPLKYGAEGKQLLRIAARNPEHAKLVEEILAAAGKNSAKETSGLLKGIASRSSTPAEIKNILKGLNTEFGALRETHFRLISKSNIHDPKLTKVLKMLVHEGFFDAVAIVISQLARDHLIFPDKHSGMDYLSASTYAHLFMHAMAFRAAFGALNATQKKLIDPLRKRYKETSLAELSVAMETGKVEFLAKKSESQLQLKEVNKKIDVLTRKSNPTEKDQALLKTLKSQKTTIERNLKEFEGEIKRLEKDIAKLRKVLMEVELGDVLVPASIAKEYPRELRKHFYEHYRDSAGDFAGIDGVMQMLTKGRLNKNGEIDGFEYGLKLLQTSRRSLLPPAEILVVMKELPAEQAIKVLEATAKKLSPEQTVTLGEMVQSIHLSKDNIPADFMIGKTSTVKGQNERAFEWRKILRNNGKEVQVDLTLSDRSLAKLAETAPEVFNKVMKQRKQGEILNFTPKEIGKIMKKNPEVLLEHASRLPEGPREIFTLAKALNIKIENGRLNPQTVEQFLQLQIHLASLGIKFSKGRALSSRNEAINLKSRNFRFTIEIKSKLKNEVRKYEKEAKAILREVKRLSKQKNPSESAISKLQIKINTFATSVILLLMPKNALAYEKTVEGVKKLYEGTDKGLGGILETIGKFNETIGNFGYVLDGVAIITLIGGGMLTAEIWAKLFTTHKLRGKSRAKDFTDGKPGLIFRRKGSIVWRLRNPKKSERADVVADNQKNIKELEKEIDNRVKSRDDIIHNRVESREDIKNLKLKIENAEGKSKSTAKGKLTRQTKKAKIEEGKKLDKEISDLQAKLETNKKLLEKAKERLAESLKVEEAAHQTLMDASKEVQKLLNEKQNGTRSIIRRMKNGEYDTQQLAEKYKNMNEIVNKMLDITGDVYPEGKIPEGKIKELNRLKNELIAETKEFNQDVARLDATELRLLKITSKDLGTLTLTSLTMGLALTWLLSSFTYSGESVESGVSSEPSGPPPKAGSGGTSGGGFKPPESGSIKPPESGSIKPPESGSIKPPESGSIKPPSNDSPSTPADDPTPADGGEPTAPPENPDYNYDWE